VSPGVVRTNLWQNMMEQDRKSMYENVCKTLLVGHVGEPAEIARAYVFLMQEGYSTARLLWSTAARCWSEWSRPTRNGFDEQLHSKGNAAAGGDALSIRGLGDQGGSELIQTKRTEKGNPRLVMIGGLLNLAAAIITMRFSLRSLASSQQEIIMWRNRDRLQGRTSK
jgi:hypothetical protein